MDPMIKYYCNLPTDHGIRNKQYIIFTQLEMHPHEGEPLSLITNVDHETQLTAATSDQKVPAHLRF